MLSAGHRLAIDYGDKWIGIAISDSSGLIASPVGTFLAEELKSELEKIAATNPISTIYLGFPIHLSGSEGRSAEKVRHFAEKIREMGIAPVRLVDERFSTSSAAHDKESVKRFGIDAVAAVEILKFALDGERLQQQPFGRSLDEK